MINLDIDNTHKQVLDFVLKQAEHIDDPPNFDAWL